MRYAFWIALLGTFVGLSRVTDRGAGEPRAMTGTVAEWRSGESIVVVNDRAAPGSCGAERHMPCPEIRMRLRGTVYQGRPATIKPGGRVTGWERTVGERRPRVA